MIEVENLDQNLPGEFFDVIDHIYTDASWYTPESKLQIASDFSIENSFYLEGESWVGIIPEKGRLAGFIHPSYEDGVAYFGYWETQEDPSVSQALFKKLEQWAYAKGIKKIQGPICFNTFGHYRVQLDHFDQNSFIGEPSNPSYYAPLCKTLGYQLSDRYYTVHAPRAGNMDEVSLAIHKRLRKKFDIRPLDQQTWLSNLDSIFSFVLETFCQKTAFSSIPLEEYRHRFGLYTAQQLCPNSSFYAVDEKGSVIGLALVYPHYGELTNQGNDNPVSLDAINYQQHFDLLENKQAIIKVVGVIPEYQNSKLLYSLMGEVLLNVEKHYTAEYTGIGVLSDLTRKMMMPSKVVSEKCYGIFSKTLCTPTTERDLSR